jgi:hypothetical protein
MIIKRNTAYALTVVILFLEVFPLFAFGAPPLRHPLNPADTIENMVGSAATQNSQATSPHIDSITSTSGEPGTQVTIVGSGFGSHQGNSLVLIGDAKATVLAWSDSRITVVIPQVSGQSSLKIIKAQNGKGPQVGINAVKSDNEITFTVTRPQTPVNGISLIDPQVYDDQTLQDMLDAARAKLASIQVFDQSGVTSRIGSLQGASQQQSSFALNVGGPALPGVAATANTGNTINTQSSGTNNQTTTPGTTQSTATTNSQLQVTGPSTQTVTTTAPATSPSVTPPASSVSLPTTFSPSASNILNEQIELMYEIAGLELLLEGPLNSRFVQVPFENRVDQLPMRHVTVGFPIDVTPSKTYQEAVAEVIVEVTAAEDGSLAKSPPIVAAILPRDKTYNVASITSSSISLGGGVITQVGSVGAGFLRGRNTYYVVQDQDTVAMQMTGDQNNPRTTRFGWQFRPVLGEKIVRSGLRLVFVQLAFPSLPSVTNFGSIQVTTQWKKYDRKRGTVETEPINGSVRTEPRTYPIPHFDLSPQISRVEKEDNGDGTLTVSVGSTYLPGTYVRIGSTSLQQGMTGTLYSPTNIRFTLPAIQLATNTAFLVDRSGATSEIVIPSVAANSKSDPCLALGNLNAKPISATAARVTVSFKFESACLDITGDTAKFTESKTPNLIAVIGNRVFGFRDLPFDSRDSKTGTLIFSVPLELLRSAHHLTVELPLWGPRFKDEKDISLPFVSSIDKAVTITQSDTEMKIALIGSGLTGLSTLLPSGAGVVLDNVSDTAAILTIPASQTKNLKQLTLKTSSGDLLLIALPDQVTAPPTLQPHVAIKKGRGAIITIQASGLESLDKIQYQNNNSKIVDLKFEVAKDKKSVIVHLPAAVTGQAGTPSLDFVFKKSSHVSYPITVFDTKLEATQPK